MEHYKENSSPMSRFSTALTLVVFLSAGYKSSYGDSRTATDLERFEYAASEAFLSLKTVDLDWCQEPDLSKIHNAARIKNSPIPKEVIELNIDGSLDRYMLDRYPDGRIKAVSELDRKSNLTGTMFSWYDSGEFLGCAELETEKHHGPSLAKYRNGTPKAFAEFYRGSQSGAELRFDRQFNLVRYANFVDGVMHGIAFFWSSSGSLIGVSEYDKGDLLREVLSIDDFEEIHFMDHQH